MKDYEYYLFDADGTLFDTAELIYQCFVYSCAKHGNRAVTRAEVFSNIGLTLRTQFEKYLGALSPEVYDRIQADHMDYQLSIYRQYLQAFPGVVEALHLLKARAKKLGVVTSRKMRSLELYLRETGMWGCFDVLVTPDDTLRHKPHPEPVLKAIDLLGARPAATVYVGDSAYDIQCGDSAGTDTVFVTWSRSSRDALPVRPTFCIDGMQELCV